MSKVKKIVIKLGTSSLTQEGDRLSKPFMFELARQLAKIHESGVSLVVVSSGSIAGGKEILNFPKEDRSLAQKQMFSSVGQARLMQIWSEHFASFQIQVGQVLMTRDDFSLRKRYLNARDAIDCLLKHRVIPIVNENDAVATEEIKVGDNDNLAARVAGLIEADLLILLTDQEGLFTSDPRVDPEAELIERVKTIDASIYELAGGSRTTLGTGGMYTKIEAAQIAAQSGTQTIIASSARANVLLDIVEGQTIGTLFDFARTTAQSRKRWILSDKRQGAIHVDQGAKAHIMDKGASLLPSGITDVTSEFDRGATVEVVFGGRAFAVGIVSYSSQEVREIAGMRSESIEETLGYTRGSTIIHRTNMTRTQDNERES